MNGGKMLQMQQTPLPTLAPVTFLLFPAVAAGEWLPQLPQGADREVLWSLISQTFTDCPAWNALSALVG
jgi:hypothetical protein